MEKIIRKPIPKKIREFIHKRDNYTCVSCKKTAEWYINHGYGKNPLTIDHKLPVKKGGDNRISNLQSMCILCNIRKSDASYKKNSYPREGIFSWSWKQGEMYSEKETYISTYRVIATAFHWKGEEEMVTNLFNFLFNPSAKI